MNTTTTPALQRICAACGRAIIGPAAFSSRTPPDVRRQLGELVAGLLPVHEACRSRRLCHCDHLVAFLAGQLWLAGCEGKTWPIVLAELRATWRGMVADVLRGRMHLLRRAWLAGAEQFDRRRRLNSIG